MSRILSIIFVILSAQIVFAQEASPPLDSINSGDRTGKMRIDGMEYEISGNQVKKLNTKDLKEDKKEVTETEYSMPIIGNKIPSLESRIKNLEDRLTEIEALLKSKD